MTKRDFLLSFPHHLERKYLQEYHGVMVSADYNESEPGKLVIRAKLNNGDNISKVLVVPDHNIQKVKEFVDKLNSLEEQDEDYLVVLYRHSEYIWFVELNWFRPTSKIIDDIRIYLSLDREYDETKKEDKEILNQKREEYVDKYIRDTKEYFNPLPVEQAGYEKAVTKFIYKYHNIQVVTDEELEIQNSLPKKEIKEVKEEKYNISPREREIIKRVYEEWAKYANKVKKEYKTGMEDINKKYDKPEDGFKNGAPNGYHTEKYDFLEEMNKKYPYNSLDLDEENMEGLKCFLRYCGIDLDNLRSVDVS